MEENFVKKSVKGKKNQGSKWIGVINIADLVENYGVGSGWELYRWFQDWCVLFDWNVKYYAHI